MNVLVIGSGGREHVLTWKIKQSPLVKKIYCAPGNGGMESIAECVDINPGAIPALVEFAKDKKIDLTVVGPEAPLVAGIVDAFEKEGLKIFGPNRQAAQLEGSKVFAKQFMMRNNIPTAKFASFGKIELAKDFLMRAKFPLVVKADGLAAGKGVIICQDLQSAKNAVDQIMQDKVFKEAGSYVVIEECLEGEEASILAISDGDRYCLLDSSQDHKRIFDDDVGPNTGGMGAYSPAPIVTQELFKEIEAKVIGPVIRGMKNEGMPFKGVLYIGLMITEEGLKVLEFNVRLGDPETQVVLSRLRTDIVEIMLASCEGGIGKIQTKWDQRSCVCVVMSAGGYPGEYEKGEEIKGLDAIDEKKDGIIFHAGTKKEGDKMVTSGGRVLGVTNFGDDIEMAIKNTYTTVEKVSFEHCFFRRDIGAKALRLMHEIPEAISHR
ncbi:Phosphoribosylamine--glycine ligase [hydrothermal vent metagenome]|uniref:phosphoribosylamine--glycine ligase n=1 Tax=hydrothermal vent metagenome TaxID=652676 RepID=A0A3B1DIP5_9ZZZZ